MARNDVQRRKPTPPAPAGIRISGLVERTVTDKGFGFITGEDGQDYFFHLSNCAAGVWDDIGRQPKGGKGVPVTFETSRTEKGLRALSVQL